MVPKFRQSRHSVYRAILLILAAVVGAHAGGAVGTAAVLNLAPIAFRPASVDLQYSLEEGGIGRLCTTKTPGIFVAEVRLPDGAAVERITAAVQRAGNEGLAVASLVRRTPTTAEFIATTAMPTDGQKLETVSVQPPAALVIDNRTYAYLLHVSLTAGGVCFSGVEIRYRMP